MMSIFTDLGPNHIVNDFDGERPVQKLITDISPLPNGECLIRYDTPEGQQPVSLSTGNFEISEVNGIENASASGASSGGGINGKVYKVNRSYSDPVKTVRITLDISGKTQYVSGGLLTEKKQPTPNPMESLANKMKTPGNVFAEPPTMVLTDLINFGSELQQHITLMSILHYSERSGGRLPRPNLKEDIDDVVKIAKSLLSTGKVAIEDFEIDEAFVAK